MTENETSKDETKQEQEQEHPKRNIKDMSSVAVEHRGARFFCMSIIGEVEGHTVLSPQSKTTKYEHVIPELVQLEENEGIDGVLFLLNTMGGDVEAGLAIAEMIASMSKPTVSIVLGGSHSIGVPLAVAADYSFIVPSATMTVHPIRTNGMVIGVPQTFQYFNKVQERLTDFVVRNSKIKETKFRQLMMETKKIANDVGTVLFGEETVECGLIDSVGGISDALKKLREFVTEQQKTKK